MNQSSNESPELAVSVSNLCRKFRGSVALDQVNISVPIGNVLGLVGINGAGKTTLIRHLIGAYKAQQGTVRILGADPVKQRVEVMRRVGYLTEEDTLPQWMSVGEMLDFCRGIQPSWDEAYATELSDMFRLTRSMKLKSMSKGQRARVGLLVAIAHRPELLILDEPSSGLDPIARGDILEAVIRTVSEDGRTVLFSSHLLDEVDRVCDSMVMIHAGKVLETLTVEQLESHYREIICKIDSGQPAPRINGAFGWQRRGAEWSAVLPVDDSGEATTGKYASLAELRPISLQRWFEARVHLAEQGSTEPNLPFNKEPTHV